MNYIRLICQYRHSPLRPIRSPKMSITSIVLSKPRKSDNTEDNLLHSSSLYRAMRPLMITSRIFGLFYNRSFVAKTYCVTLIIIHILNTTRFSLLFNKNETVGPEFAAKMCLVLWFLELTICNVIFTTKSPTMCKLFDCHERHVQTYGSTFGLQRDQLFKSVKVLCTVLTLIQIAFVIVTGTTMVTSINDPDIMHNMLLPFDVESKSKSYKKAMFILLNAPVSIITSATLTGCCSLFVCVAYILWKEFALLNDVIHSKTQNPGFESVVEDLRIIHGDLCRLVGVADDILSLFLANVYSIAIVIFCLAVYMGIYGGDDMYTLQGVGLYLGYNSVVLSTLTFCAVKVNTEVGILV